MVPGCSYHAAQESCTTALESSLIEEWLNLTSRIGFNYCSPISGRRLRCEVCFFASSSSVHSRFGVNQKIAQIEREEN
jgi:hypothetical protein